MLIAMPLDKSPIVNFLSMIELIIRSRDKSELISHFRKLEGLIRGGCERGTLMDGWKLREIEED